MEEKKPTQLINSLTFGLLTGLTFIAFSVLTINMNMGQSPISWLGYGILVGGLWWGAVNYRDKALNGFMSYGEAFRSLFFTLLFASVLMTIFMFIYFKYINVDYFDSAKVKAEEQMREKGMSDEQIEMGMKYAATFMSPAWVATFTLLGYLIIGSILSAIAAAFIKKENPDQFGENNQSENSN